MRSLINGLWSILSIALALLVLGAVWYYRGGFITVAAQIDDMDIEGALVEVDGRYVGETPIRLRLTPWFHNINVMYDGVDTNESQIDWYLFGMQFDKTITGEFTLAEHALD